MEDHLNRSLVLWVYNSEFDVVREVELVPRRGWGGEGALGAVLGYGALHRVPIGLGEEVQAPGEQLFDADRKSVDLLHNGNGMADVFQPAPPPASTLPPPPMVNPNVAPPPMLNPNAAPPAGVPHRARKGRAGAKSPNHAFDDMFSEGAKKSAEGRPCLVEKRHTSGSTSYQAEWGQAPAPPQAQSREDAQDEVGSLGEPGDAEET